ncbi:hypothetical protein [Tranquillimonas rosea]|uniref:hypothetical protein n=1 Tax=Tranquillimonas rosea TaxID=641238 RepID=UPI003BAC62C1
MASLKEDLIATVREHLEHDQHAAFTDVDGEFAAAWREVEDMMAKPEGPDAMEVAKEARLEGAR